MTLAKPPLGATLRALARGRADRPHERSVLAAWAQVALALVVALGSIGLASLAAIIAPDPGVQEQVVTAARRAASSTVPAPPSESRAPRRRSGDTAARVR